MTRRRDHDSKQRHQSIPAGRAALLSIISAARRVLRMLLFWGPGALLNRDILTVFVDAGGDNDDVYSWRWNVALKERAGQS